MRNFFKYFDLSLAEKRGFIALVLLILCALSIPYLYKLIRTEDSLTYDLVDLEQSDKREKQLYRNKDYTKSSHSKKISPTADFDPNGLSLEEWQELGLSEKQARVIKNYEAKGGKFFEKEDLAKMYSISKSEYEKLAPFVKINRDLLQANKEKLSSKSYGKKAEIVKETDQPVTRKKIMIDIMQADSIDWVALRGIGPVFAKRILNYRKALGGFSSIAQVAEVYGLPPETFTAIKDQLYLSPNSTVHTIDINKCTIEQLAKHPYVSKKQAQWIVNYRIQHGAFKDFSSLADIQLLDQDFFRKIEPYLEF
ncbi:ComEA family DNA-binding protein [Sphingobacterium paucimobilis]|uniref:Competence protein ComEA n=1 Tax=Sphingobacterium paucimobilis HER1398 TaxID=1346330 RepID=U2JF27_9SPHI|nr:helix-hairpin-helix domain-containing protein [Sphingobacterium paucimobilis]ERJ61278.1 hypothetical protein M472_21220 [Sphingobacterium paucimobilis HER1398]